MMKERVVGLKMPFMKIQDLLCSRQKLVRGSILNMPVDTESTSNILPRNMGNT